MESTLRISAPVRRATASARSDFPEAVGPRITRRFRQSDAPAAISATTVKVAGTTRERPRRHHLQIAEKPALAAWPPVVNLARPLFWTGCGILSNSEASDRRKESQSWHYQPG